MQADGSERQVVFDDPAYAITLPSPQDYAATTVRVGYETPASPMRWYDVDLASGERALAGETRLRGFDPSLYAVDRIEAVAEDGVAVPVTVLSRRDAPRDGSAPLLIYGYGAYGVSSDPVFSLPAAVLVDAGWRYAIAHVRGGSEKGQQWFLEGRRFKKRNSMTDFVACARHLAEEGYASRERIVAYGLSAGGLLVGGAMNIAPDLFAGVIAKVPFVDMLNTMSDADHPLVPLFRPDWGDPLADPEAYDYIRSISPYENVAAAPYPPLLCTAGLKDDRVSYWEPAKLVAEVRHRSTGGNPAILLVENDAGHQGSADLRSEYTEMARFWAFAERCVTPCSG
jgi:oligopeptidase B